MGNGGPNISIVLEAPPSPSLEGQELSRRDDRDGLERLEDQQIVVPGDKAVNFGRTGESQHRIVIWISTNWCIEWLRFHDSGFSIE